MALVDTGLWGPDMALSLIIEGRFATRQKWFVPVSRHEFRALEPGTDGAPHHSNLSFTCSLGDPLALQEHRMDPCISGRWE